MKGEAAAAAVGKSNPLSSWKVLTKHRVRIGSDARKDGIGRVALTHPVGAHPWENGKLEARTVEKKAASSHFIPELTWCRMRNSTG